MRRNDGGWVTAVTTRPGDIPGTLSSNEIQGREILFAIFEGDLVQIFRSTGGLDWKVDDGRMRHVVMEGRELVATLKKGESYERWVRPDGLPMVRMRWYFT
jgi:hypothetical protein